MAPFVGSTGGSATGLSATDAWRIALSVISLTMQKSVVESAGQRTHVIRSPRQHTQSDPSLNRGIAADPGEDPLANLSRLGAHCNEVALRASAFGAGVNLEPIWAPKRRNNHRQVHFIATGQTVRAAYLSL